MNIRTLDDYKEYLLDIGRDEQWVEDNAESRYSDWAYEAIRMKWVEGETTILVENTEREGYDPATRSWPAFIKKKVSGIWKWMNTIETGGYWEHYDHNDERTIRYHGYLQKCYCDDAQFVFYGTDDLCGYCFSNPLLSDFPDNMDMNMEGEE